MRLGDTALTKVESQPPLQLHSLTGPFLVYYISEQSDTML